MKLVYAMCGSFCTHEKSLNILKKLASEHTVVPAFSEIARTADTRFGTAADLLKKVFAFTDKEPICGVPQAESVVTRGGFDAVIVSPCTGNTLAKIANGITDNTVTMCVKAQLRNLKPVIIALATNDGLGANLKNIAAALEKKNIYFVPFGQDAPLDKPTSLICDFSLLELTLDFALKGKQIQPLLL